MTSENLSTLTPLIPPARLTGIKINYPAPLISRLLMQNIHIKQLDIIPILVYIHDYKSFWLPF